MRHLRIKHTQPLEREFEAWVIAGMESYLESLSIPYSIVAVSPALEQVWPADERVFVNGKVFGLQFKQAKLSGSTLPPPAQLHWSFHQPPGQFSLVINNPDIFYCLPTFVNRDYRKQALHHCLFWRPDPKLKNMNAWYSNSGASTPYNEIRTANRWGHFIEQVLSCNFGKKVQSVQDFSSFITEIKLRSVEPDRERVNIDAAERGSDEGLYAVALSIQR